MARLGIAWRLAAAWVAVLLLAGCGAADPASIGMPPTAARTPAVVRATVSRHVDGDTLHVTLANGRDERVRLIGVNTPESTTRHEPYGEAASRYTAAAAPLRSSVWLETDVALRDRYGRMLAYVWLARPRSDAPSEVRALMLNARLLADGYAQQMTVPPNVRYADAFGPLEAEARDANRGSWALPRR